MSQPAARITDLHTCPMQTPMPPPAPPVPHVGGPIIGPGATTALIGGQPAARVSDSCTCVGPPDTIVKGSPTVMIGGLMAARMGDSTAHGGVIAAGFVTVMIGDQGSGAGGGAGGAQATGSLGTALHRESQRASLVEAAQDGTPFCEECERARLRLVAEPPSPSPLVHAAAQRASLRAAARAGVPFCEECERARARLAAEPPAVAAPPAAAMRQAADGGEPFVVA